MGLYDILVVADESALRDDRLKLALVLADTHGAHLDGAFVAADRGAVTLPNAMEIAAAQLGGGIVPPGLASDITHAVSVAEIIERRFREGREALGINGEWHSLVPGDVNAAIALARSADLTIIGQKNPRSHAVPGLRPEDIVLRSGRPVLVVPYAGRFFYVGRRVLVGWDGTQEAARALGAALPLIEDAITVTLLTVRRRDEQFERERPSITRAVRHLERHGIRARSREVRQEGMAVGDILLSHAADVGADLIVAGACHRSRLRESLMGGVSHELFRQMTIPVLMSH